MNSIFWVIGVVVVIGVLFGFLQFCVIRTPKLPPQADGI